MRAMKDFSLYHAACAADDAWMDEIRKAFPRQWAGNVRYTQEGIGKEGSSLRAAYDRWKEANEAWRNEMEATRREANANA
jgi:hypothetical protein